MKYRIYLLGVALLVLVTAGILSILKAGGQPKAILTELKSEKSMASAASAASSQALPEAGAVGATKDSKTSDRKRPESKDPELVAKYGESRVNLARHITNDALACANDMLEMGGLAGIEKLMSMGDETKDDSEVAKKLGPVFENLKLNADQMKKVTAALAEMNKRRMAEAEDVFKQTSKDPTRMMKLLLAGDAAARGEIDESEFTRITSEIKKSGSGSVRTLMVMSKDDENPLNNELFVSRFKGLLDPEQNRVVDDELKKLAADQPDEKESREVEFEDQKNLEDVNTIISSGRKMIGGLKTLTDGLKGFPKALLKE